jgi:hypothetical protein
MFFDALENLFKTDFRSTLFYPQLQNKINQAKMVRVNTKGDLIHFIKTFI